MAVPKRRTSRSKRNMRRANHDKVTAPFPETPLSVVGAVGTVAGVTAAEGVLGGLVPTELVALTVKM